MSLMQQGERLGDYRVLSHLGSGGMGEVYVAEDSRLGRKVALKILPVATTGDAHRRHRFVNEARAASALQHPNIVTVFELGRDGERDFIAMELVEGESLRDHLSRGRIAPRRALEVGAQIASALEAGHAAGVVHRDIKPENILISSNGTAKLLDYGLAKRDEAKLPIELDAPTVLAMHTEPGAILGTVAYMSPEQAEGLMTDSRTDIFSLGVVLYEMLTGRKPFQGKSVVDQLHKIINTDPPSPQELNPDLPAGASDVLEKALAKQRENRYQHAGDLRIDLRRLQSATAVTQHVRRTNRWLVGALVVSLLVALAAIYAAVVRTSPAATAAAEPLALARMSPFTIDPGYEDEPTFSPDGEAIAYVSDRSGNLEIYLRQTGGGPDINLTNNPADDAQPKWSPDGKQIAFVSTRESISGLVYRNPGSPLLGGDIWVMPAFGGRPRRLVREANFPSWSPDGTKILYSAGPWRDQKIYTVAVTGGTPREVPIRFAGRDLFVVHPTFSPDGRWILFQTGNRLIYVAAAGGGPARQVAQGLTPSWSFDGKEILFSTAAPGRNFSLTALPFSSARGEADGPPRPLTFGRGREVSAVMSRDGKRIAFAGQTVTFNIEKIRLDTTGGTSSGDPVPLTQGLQLSPFFDVSRDGRSIVYQSKGLGTDIWRLDEGGLPIQLTSGLDEATATQPAFSPDEKLVAFARSTGDAELGEMWVMNADGTDPRLVFQDGSAFLTWTPDGRGLAYYSRSQGQIMLYDLDSRTRRALTDEKDVRSIQTISDDGQWLVYQTHGIGGTTDIHAVRFGQVAPTVTVVATHHEDFHPELDAEGKWLYFQFDHRNVYRVPGPAEGWRKAEPQQVTHFPESNLFIDVPQVTRDSKWLVYSRGRTDSDLWLMELPPPSGR